MALAGHGGRLSFSAVLRQIGLRWHNFGASGVIPCSIEQVITLEAPKSVHLSRVGPVYGSIDCRRHTHGKYINIQTCSVSIAALAVNSICTRVASALSTPLHVVLTALAAMHQSSIDITP
jgi:hypothetical protein